MHELLRIWRRVEALPVSAGVDADWKELLGDDLRVLEPYLKPEQQLATSYLCPHPVHDNCPRRVIHHGPDDIVAVCGNASPQCEPLKLTRSDLVVRSLKTKEWIAAIVKGLREANGLDALELDTPDEVVALGTLARRGRRLAIIWIRREVDDVETLARGIRSTLNGVDLVVVLPPGVRSATDRPMAGAAIVLLAAPTNDQGQLNLYRALDILDPGYRERRTTEPLAIFDEVELEFATVPGERHVVRINGRDFGGFQKSDLKFLRLVNLAAARAADADVEDGGWIKMFKLQVADDKDRGLGKLREELRKYEHPDLTEDERAALVKTSPTRDSRVRLAVNPRHIVFDRSLADFQFIGEQQTVSKTGKRRRTPGAADLERNLATGQKVAKKLLADARKLGVPGPTETRG